MIPAVAPGTYLVLRTNGDEESCPSPAMTEMKKAIGADTIDTVILTWASRSIPDLVMLVNDCGYLSIERETPTGVELIPQKALLPVNHRATELYWSVCKPGTTFQIVGDVAICHDRDTARTAQRSNGPGFWMHETTGVLQPAVEAYLTGQPMTPEHIAVMRAYLRQWIAAPGWDQNCANPLDRAVLVGMRGTIDALTTREAISAWIDQATDNGMDPL